MNIFKKLFGQKHDDGETPEFRALIDGSMQGLQLQSEAHQAAWRFWELESWEFSQDTGELMFTFSDMVVRAPAQILARSTLERAVGCGAGPIRPSRIHSLEIQSESDSMVSTIAFAGSRAPLGLARRWMAGTWRRSRIGCARTMVLTVGLRARCLFFLLSDRFG